MFKLKIKHYRKLKRWTQEHLAEKAGTSQEYISVLEQEPRTKSPTLHVLECIASAFDICPKELLICQCDRCKKERAS